MNGFKKITKYMLAWDVGQDGGPIFISLEGSTSPLQLQVNNAAEFIAISQILKQGNAEYDPTTQRLRSQT